MSVHIALRTRAAGLHAASTRRARTLANAAKATLAKEMTQIHSLAPTSTSVTLKTADAGSIRKMLPSALCAPMPQADSTAATAQLRW